LNKLVHRQIDTPEAMELFGGQLAKNCGKGTCVYLQGELGAGKTTLVRGFLRGKAYEGKVKSPTYTLVEPYELADTTVFHFDLYRVNDPDELDYFGFRDYFDGESIVLLEWPEKAAPVLDEPDLLIFIKLSADTRLLILEAKTALGQQLLLKIQ